MKTLSDHVIIYDDACPMCEMYTGAFVKTGMLEKSGRISYSEMPAQVSTAIDAERSRDEIALVNTKSGNVTYGIDSLFMILGNSCVGLKPLFRNRFFRATMKQLYFFISYNRKVIAPPPAFEAPSDCTPRFHLGYRWAYIVFCWLVTSMILNSYSALLTSYIPGSSYMREWFICGGQILFQSAVIMLARQPRLMHYLGNMMTVSLLGAIMLLPVLVLANTGVSIPVWISAGWFLTIVAFMLIEHGRRVRLLALPSWLTATWVLYRILILWIII